MRQARRILVFGGARSGKSEYAEGLALAGGDRLIYLATAQAHDAEMEKRIAVHKSRRGREWQAVEEPVDVAGVLARFDNQETTILLDCLTLWLSNLMFSNSDLDHEVNKLIQAIEGFTGRLIIVSNELGMSIVPENALAREFRDGAGLLNQKVAAACDEVFFVAAGLPLRLKPTPL